MANHEHFESYIDLQSFSELLEQSILPQLHTNEYVQGLTHNFYRYPARMYPGLVHALVERFSNRDDYILDPFMGGGTTVVEALATGRQAIGFDTNSLAYFITRVKTTPLSEYDEVAVHSALCRPYEQPTEVASRTPVRLRYLENVPVEAIPIFGELLSRATSLYYPRQERFARCAVLRVGQWALDSRTRLPTEAQLVHAVGESVDEMLHGLREFVERARAHRIPKNRLTGRRLLLRRSAVGAEQDPRLYRVLRQPRLVITSPPYPGVHVLYHRWQVHGRRETPAPYWFIGAKDGNSASYYTMGSRTSLGLDNYFASIVAAFRSVRAIVHPDAVVVQVVAFADADRQLPRFLAAMEAAGFCELLPKGVDRADLWRIVPNRKWYNRTGASPVPARELLLFHRPCPAGIADAASRPARGSASE